MRATTGSPKHTITVALLPGGHTKVSDLDVLVAVEQQVFWLEISVGNIEVMAVVNSSDDLLKVNQSFRSRKSSVFANIVEELPAFYVLQNQVKLGRGLPDVVKPHDVRVFNELHDNNLPFNTLENPLVVLGETVQRHAGVNESVFRDDFDGGILFGLRVPSNSDPPFVAFSKESFP